MISAGVVASFIPFLKSAFINRLESVLRISRCISADFSGTTMAKYIQLAFHLSRYSPLIWLYEKHSAGFVTYLLLHGESQIHLLFLWRSPPLV